MTLESVRKRVFSRYGEVCALCGRTMEERIQGLSVHHINGNDSDNRIENLIPVCQSCHLNIHSKDTPPFGWFYRRLPEGKRR
jgi:5-methylcytosine-specific restriction endonuclease McrA